MHNVKSSWGKYFGPHPLSAEPLQFPRISVDFIVTLQQNGAKIEKKQHQNSESTWKVDLNQLYASKSGRAPGFHFVTPRNVAEQNVV